MRSPNSIQSKAVSSLLFILDTNYIDTGTVKNAHLKLNPKKKVMIYINIRVWILILLMIIRIIIIVNIIQWPPFPLSVNCEREEGTLGPNNG